MSNIWLVTVILKGSPLQHLLRFKTKAKAEIAIDHLLTDMDVVATEDDFDTSMQIVADEIASITVTNVAKATKGALAQEAATK